MRQRNEYALKAQSLFLKWIRVDDIDVIRNLIENSEKGGEESSHKTIIEKIISIIKVFQWTQGGDTCVKNIIDVTIIWYLIIYKTNILKNQNHRFLNFIDLSLCDKIIASFIIIFFIIFFLFLSPLSPFSSFSSFSFRFARLRLCLSLCYCYDEIYNEGVSFFSNCSEGDSFFSNCDNTRNASDVSDINESSVKDKIIFLIELLSLFMSSKRSKSRWFQPRIKISCCWLTYIVFLFWIIFRFMICSSS